MIDEPKKYTEKQLLFLDALMGEAGGNIRKAMDIAGYSKTTKSGEVVKNLREEVIERASLMLAMNAPKAAFGIIGVLDDPSAMGARNSISAAREILDRTGLVKKEQVEVTSQGGGMFILPPKSSDDMG
jgi:hypothetical protein|tara:strand:- start:179 stop:562 length:384 start_codon:yes stop_codon:yes gene_type:complete